MIYVRWWMWATTKSPMKGRVGTRWATSKCSNSGGKWQPPPFDQMASSLSTGLAGGSKDAKLDADLSYLNELGPRLTWTWEPVRQSMEAPCPRPHRLDQSPPFRSQSSPQFSWIEPRLCPISLCACSEMHALLFVHVGAAVCGRLLFSWEITPVWWYLVHLEPRKKIK